jgi:hypothetical protein
MQLCTAEFVNILIGFTQMPVTLGGDKAHKIRTIGDIVCAFQWVNEEPAMVLFPKVKRTMTNGAFVLCLSSAYKYTNVRYLIAQAFAAAKQLGFDDSKFAAHQIADIIIEGLPDLVEMPPMPTQEQKLEQSIGEMLLKVDGKIIKHEEITMPDMGQTA